MKAWSSGRVKAVELCLVRAKERAGAGQCPAKVVPTIATNSSGKPINRTAMIVTGLTIGVLLVVLLVLLLVKHGHRPRLRVNGVLNLQVEQGTSLMTALAAQGIQLPGTCGGKGACTGCKCQVFSGGGPISPQEAPYFSKEAIRDHWRLACQVVVRGDISIRVPDDLLPVGTVTPSRE